MEKHRPHDLANEGRHDARGRHVHGGDARLFRFTDDLPFRPDWQQVIYVEDGFHKDVNDFLNANYDAICGAMREAGFAFCYLPRLAQELRASGFVSYFTPYQDRAVGASPSSSRLMPYLAEGETMPRASLLVLRGFRIGRQGLCVLVVRDGASGTAAVAQHPAPAPAGKEETEVRCPLLQYAYDTDARRGLCRRMFRRRDTEPHGRGAREDSAAAPTRRKRDGTLSVAHAGDEAEPTAHK